MITTHRGPDWVPQSTFGLLALYLTLALFVALPVSHASELEWYFPTPHNHKDYYALAATILTTALLATLRKINWTNSPTQKPVDGHHNAYQILRERTFNAHKGSPDLPEDLPGLARFSLELGHKDLRDNQNLEAIHELARLCLTLYKLEEHLAAQGDLAEDLQEDVKAQQHTLQEWHKIGMLFFQDAADYEYAEGVEPAARKARDLSQLSPYISAFNLHPTITPNNAQELAQLLKDRVIQELLTIWNELPEHARIEKPSLLEQLTEGARKLKEGVKRATQPPQPPLTESASGREETIDLSELASALPPGALNPGDALTRDTWRSILRLAFNESRNQGRREAIMEQPPVPTPAACTHPEELAADLAQPPATPWETLRAEARRLRSRMSDIQCDHPARLAQVLGRDAVVGFDRLLDFVRALIPEQRPRPPLEPEAPAPDSDDGMELDEEIADNDYTEMFKPENVPLLDDNVEDYWVWHCRFEEFASIYNPHPSVLPRALATCYDRLKGRYAKMIIAWNPRDVRRANWRLTWQRFLEVCDAYFIEYGYATQRYDKWVKMRYDSKTQGRTFIQNFVMEAQLLNRIALAVAGEIPVLTEEEMFRTLYNKLPEKLRLDILDKDRHFLTRDAPVLERMEFISREWEHYLRHNPPPAPRSSNSRSHAAIARTPASDSPELKIRGCGKKSSYECPAPAVRKEARGSLYPKKEDSPADISAKEARLEFCVRHNLCEACRRPREEHAPGDVFKPVRRRLMPTTVASAGQPRPASPAPSSQSLD